MEEDYEVYEDSVPVNAESGGGEATYSDTDSEYDVAVGADCVDGQEIEETENSDTVIDSALDERLTAIEETMANTTTYGTMGNYYNSALGFTVFPTWDVYQYFVDIDAEGFAWSETSNGHFVPTDNLETYEAYIASQAETEEEPTEHEVQSLESLQGMDEALQDIQTTLATMQTEITAYQTESLKLQQETLEYQKVTCYSLIAICFFLALACGNMFANTFFNRMRG